MRALGKHKLLASLASTKLEQLPKVRFFVSASETQTLWSQTNYNPLYTDIVYSKHMLQAVHVQSTNACTADLQNKQCATGLCA